MPKRYYLFVIRGTITSDQSEHP